MAVRRKASGVLIELSELEKGQAFLSPPIGNTQISQFRFRVKRFVQQRNVRHATNHRHTGLRWTLERSFRIFHAAYPLLIQVRFRSRR